MVARRGSKQDILEQMAKALAPFADSLIQMGREIERADLQTKLGWTTRPQETAENVLADAPLPFGFIANTIRKVVDEKGRAHPLSINMIIDLAQKKAAPAKVTEEQIRPALKGLAKNEELKRVDRGMYRAGPKLVVPE
jgi:hypothetical protein